MITVDKISDDSFRVTISKGITTSHQVHLTQDYWEQLTDEAVPRRILIEKSIEFLLEHESQSSIQQSFDLHQIGYYFSEFESEIKERLKNDQF